MSASELANSSDELIGTRYLGQHEIISRVPPNGSYHNTENFHLFVNEISFVDLEQSFVKRGGVYGSQTIYLFRKLQIGKNGEGEESTSDQEAEIKWQLAGVVTNYQSNRPGVYANLAESFSNLDDTFSKE